jgi:hypothetical protein
MYSLTKAAGIHFRWKRSDALGRKVLRDGVGVARADHPIPEP